MKNKINAITAALVAALTLAGCSDSDDDDSSTPSKVTASVTLTDNSNSATSQEAFPHSAVSDGYTVVYIDNTGNEYQETDVSLNTPIEITFEGSAMITVSHPNNINGVQTSYVLSADELTANSDADIEVPMYNNDWQAISISCSGVNAATLGVMTESCDQNSDITFYQKGNAHDLFVTFERGFKSYPLQDREVIVGDHHHLTFDIPATTSESQSAQAEYQSESSWNYLPQTITIADGELEEYVGKNLDEVTLYEGYMEVASYSNETSNLETDSPILTSSYNVITLHGLQEKPGYPLSAYKEPVVKIENHSGVNTGFMNLYLDSASKANQDEMAFIVYFDDQGFVNQITSSEHSYSDWNSFVIAHSNNLVNSSFMMNDLDMASIADCVLDTGPQSSDLGDFLSGLIDEECTKDLVTEIQQDGIEHIHVGNFFWRSNDSTVTEEVRLDIHEFDVGLADVSADRSTVHQANSRGIENFEFDGSQTTVSWTAAEPKVWIKDIAEGVTLNQTLVSNLTTDLANNPNSYINVYLINGTMNKCVVLHSDNTFSITGETETATCTGTIESGLDLVELESKTSGFTVRSDYFDVLDRGNFFWRGMEVTSQTATFADYTLNQ
ncbi:hypothetical protein BCT04_00625 [Vibrio breoganii]|uniref:hypothetical protein n=1 Tax=Vibrio breoganii TaxID=553239 RepID=UPI000C85D6AA|nr:hypothetical protein [Vibrio breoganii]PMO67517.1 hypothetical protein BCT04_00625 [Vibrio breoganii]